jgi:hypothetical protein
VLQLTSPEAVDLIKAFAMLRYCGAGEAGIEAWKRWASAFLLRQIGGSASARAGIGELMNKSAAATVRSHLCPKCPMSCDGRVH